MPLLPAVFVLLAWAAAVVAGAAPAQAGWASAREITASDTLFTGTYILGGPGDLILENDRIAVVISDTRRPSPYTLSGGNIIDAGLRSDRIDGLMEVYTYFDDHYPRQAVYETIEIIDDGAGGGPAIIRASGLDSDDPYITVGTEYSLDAGADHVHISTTLQNDGPGTLESFELGDAFLWGDCMKYVPGYGFSIWGDAVSAWVAGTTELVSYGYAGAGGADVQGEHKDLWSHINVQTVALVPGEPVTYERYFIVGGRDIASVATAIHAVTAAPAGSLFCTVIDADTSTPLVDCKIEVFDESEDPYLQMQTDGEGLASTTLPAGTWRLETDKDGYEPSEITLLITEGGHVAHDFAIEERNTAIPGMGDTLTVIQRPLLNIPSFVRPGDVLLIECDAHPTVTGWEATLLRGDTAIPLEVTSSNYNTSTLWWSISAAVPEVPVYGLYDLAVAASGGVVDTTRHAVEVIPHYKRDYYFVHITDTHLPTHRYHYQDGAATDSSEMVDLRKVIEDINIINPEFVLITGDFINEGELEDYLNRRYYSKAQRMLTEFEVPTFLIAGNHDIGGWWDTPPPAGTARRDWWRFFGWKRLDSPPPGAPWYTQNYSFNYGPVHYVALEAYDNYDGWRYGVYGGDSFTSGQMQWLRDNLAAASGSSARVLFYHYDFSWQINLQQLGADMALWGHIHRDAGSIDIEPYNLATNNLCDGERSYRLIRVSDGTLHPTRTVSAGNAGRNLEVDYEPANNGSRDSVTAYITNNLDERFEHAMLQFLMPPDCDSLVITGGTLIATEDLESATRYYVGVDILPSSSAEVTAVVDSCGAPGDTTDIDRLSLARNKPNPFNPRTFLSFTLPTAGRARLAVYDVLGREVKVLVDSSLEPGPHGEEWDGTDHHGRPANSGVYFARLSFGGTDQVVKMVLMR